jgi:hypothetical protein
MYSKWIKSGFVLAMLLISMVSLSMAACPWFIINELYNAQCGVEKVVPASAGLLANDATAIAVLDPDAITIDAKYGTLDVNADGSFVFAPSPDILPGTYVQFKYNATNGDCQARYPGIAKILVSCKCRTQVANLNLCLPTTLAEIRQKLVAAGVGCVGCGATPATIDLSNVKLVPGTYSFSVKCGSYQAVFGTVTLVSGCEANAPSFTFCEGTVTLAQLRGMINAQADCIGTGCDQAPVINTAGVTVANGFVTGGSYTSTCGAGTNCADTATGTITVTPRCKASAPSFTFCEGTVTLAQLQGMINAQADCTGTGCDQAPVINTAGVTVANGFVTGGSYTATCGAGTDCADTATGTITMVPRCEVDLISVALECGTPAQIEAQIKEENSAPCGDCDTAPAFQFPVWTLRADGSGNVANGVYQYTVTCNAGSLEGCDSSAIGEVIVDCQLPCPCVATAKDVTVCAGMVTLDQLKANYLRGNVSCISTIGTFCDVTAEIDTENVTVDTNGFVTGGTYKAICQPTEDCLPVEATGTVTAIDCCTCEANAPSFTFCEGTVTLAQLPGMINAQADCTGTGCDQAPVINTAGVTVANGFVTGGSYTATCGAGTVCEDTATGAITVVPRCEVDLIAVSLGCGTPAQIEAQIKDENSAPCADCDTTPAFQFPVWPLRADGSGNVANGVYQYTVTCNAGGLEGCDSSAMGEVIVDCQLPCPCVATAKDVTVCAGLVTLDQLKANYLPGNVSCKSTIGAFCDITAEINTSGVTVDTNGFVTGGTYKAICQSNTDDCLAVEATATVTTKTCDLCISCEASAPGFTFCEGTVTLAQLQGMIFAQADCTGTGCDQSPVINTAGVTVANGFVTGGSYTATCGAGTVCEDTATGTITVVPRCEVDLVSVTLGCGAPAQIEAQIKDENSAPCADCDTTPTFQFPVWPLRADGSGNVANGVYRYTVTCNAGGLEGCDSSAEGEVIVDCQLPCPCVATAKDVTVCAGMVTLDQLKANYLRGNVSCISTIGTFCDVTAEIDTENVTVDTNGFVTGGTYKAICQPTEDCLPAEATGTVTAIDCCTCEANAPSFTFCEGTVTLAQLQGMINAQADCTGTGCDQAPLINTAGVTVANGFVTGGSYTATCAAGTNCEDTASGTITVIPRCEARAPGLRFCEGTVTLDQLTNMIKAQATCTGNDCSEPTIDLSDVDVVDGFVSGGSYTYTATCGAGTDCEDTATGTITVVQRCEVDPVSMASCGTPAQIEAEIEAENQFSCGDCDTNPAFQFPVWPLRADGSGKVANGVYLFTVTCNAGGLAGCDSSAQGEVIVDCQEPCPCVATAKDVTVCAGLVTLDQLEANYLPGNVSCRSTIGTLCDITAEINTDDVTVDANGFVTGGTYKAICQSNTDDCLAVEATGKVATKTCELCTCEAIAPDICVPYICSRTTCHKYTLDEIKNEIKANGGGCSTGCTMTLKFYKDGVETSFTDLFWNGVYHYTYKVTCTKGTCVDIDTGRLDVLKLVDCSCTTCNC